MRALLATARATYATFPATERVHLCVQLPALVALLQRGGRELLQLPNLPAPLVLLSPHPNEIEQSVALGFGEAARLCPMGTQRIEDLIQNGHDLFASLHVLRAADCNAAPSPRLYGGLRFAPQGDAASDRDSSSDEDPWAGLPDAHFVLPRWGLILHEGLGYLQLNVRAGELADSAEIERELSAIEAACDAGRESSLPAPLQSHSVAFSAADAEPWQRLVERALAEIAQGHIDKVVLARGQRLASLASCEVPAVLSRLSAEYGTCLRFALPLLDATLVGATPELLIARQGRKVRCDALAGSLPRRDPDTDAGSSALQQQADLLLADEKESREHAHVVSALRQRLQPYVQPIAATSPQTRVLRNLIHLWTPLQAELLQPTHVLRLLAILHPTPAVCGVPQQAAARFISTQEALPRGYYAAPVGWFDGGGDGEFYVAIRSALLRHGQAWLFAGAGIVAGSQPAKEFRETAAKLQPMLTALGVTTSPAVPTAALRSEA